MTDAQLIALMAQLSLANGGAGWYAEPHQISTVIGQCAAVLRAAESSWRQEHAKPIDIPDYETYKANEEPNG